MLLLQADHLQEFQLLSQEEEDRRSWRLELWMRLLVENETSETEDCREAGAEVMETAWSSLSSSSACICTEGGQPGAELGCAWLHL